jgi:hypothetical protein
MDDVQEKGLMIIWRGNGKQPGGHIGTLYPDKERDGTITLPFHTYGTFKDLQINWLIIPPGKVATQDE